MCEDALLCIRFSLPNLVKNKAGRRRRGGGGLLRARERASGGGFFFPSLSNSLSLSLSLSLPPILYAGAPLPEEGTAAAWCF